MDSKVEDSEFMDSEVSYLKILNFLNSRPKLIIFHVIAV